MYYHARPLRHVKWDRIGPPPIQELDPDFRVAYRWLGQYCGFYPQVWLARSHNAITGFRIRARYERDLILFGFEHIKGFAVDYDFWCLLLTRFSNCSDLGGANAALPDLLASWNDDPDFADFPPARTWRETRDASEVLRQHLFVKRDQVVLPSLNLKSAKQILCRNERQKRVLRRMGFLEDRITLVNVERNSSG